MKRGNIGHRILSFWFSQKNPPEATFKRIFFFSGVAKRSLLLKNLWGTLFAFTRVLRNYRSSCASL